MNELVSEIIRILHAGGEIASESFPLDGTARVTSSQISVSVDAIILSQRLLDNYLGTSSGLKNAAMQLETTIGLHVFCPYSHGTACGKSAQNAAFLLQKGVGNYRVSKIRVGETWYDEKSDCFRADVSVTLNAFVSQGEV